jgi:hypothetical protein
MKRLLIDASALLALLLLLAILLSPLVLRDIFGQKDRLTFLGIKSSPTIQLSETIAKNEHIAPIFQFPHETEE